MKKKNPHPSCLPASSLSSSLSDQKVVSVALARPIQAAFTYLVPKDKVDFLKKGQIVKVSFGRSQAFAYVLEDPRDLTDIEKTLLPKLKPIAQTFEKDLWISSLCFSLGKWIACYYRASLGEVFRFMIPPALVKTVRKSRWKLPKVVSHVENDLLNSKIWTEEQKKSILEISSAIESKAFSSFLLHGVTGSGKTLVYLACAQQALSQGRNVLLLVPEIALSSQLYHVFFNHFGPEQVALWHSALPISFRKKLWLELRRGTRRILIGARSALFTPMKDLGLVIVDEEHDGSYKQEDRVWYQGRDMAVLRAKFENATVVLGSATPSLETQFQVQRGRYKKCVMQKRPRARSMPQIQIVSLLKEECHPQLKTTFALTTLNKIQETLDRGEQALLFLNKRGYAALFLCRSCGNVAKCPACSVSLTLHKRTKKLICHFCGYQESPFLKCPSCQSSERKPLGTGTERLEEELQNVLHGCSILRLDRDQMTSMSRLEKGLKKFREGAYNLLLGTQMVVKGHDFPSVTLVVVVLADQLFRFPDFRSTERAYQILKQVSGRAGRGEKQGRVLVQSYFPEHPVLELLKGSYSEEQFWKEELHMRKALRYPPFVRLARLRLEGSDLSILKQKSIQFVSELKKHSGASVRVLGPTPSFIEKVRSMYRRDILLKGENPQALQQFLDYSEKVGNQMKLRLHLDVDPYGI